MSRILHISVILRVAFVHSIAALIAGGGAVLMVRYSGEMPAALVVALAHGVLAVAFGFVFRLAWWWAPFNLVAAPLLLMVQGMDIPSWVFLVLFLVLLLIYWNSAREGVPLYLSNRATVRALATLLPGDAANGSAGRVLRFIDLGSGTGSVVLQLKALRHDIDVTGVETAPIPWFIGKIRFLLPGGAQVDLRRESIWDCDLGAFDVAYCFLAPPPMAALYEKARAEMKPGSLLISNSFAVPGVEPAQTVEVADRRGTRLLIYELGA